MWALRSWDVLRMKKPFFFSNDISIVMTLRKAGPSHLILPDLLILPNTKFSSGGFLFFYLWIYLFAINNQIESVGSPLSISMGLRCSGQRTVANVHPFNTALAQV